jgi:hypothetical protein
VAYRKVLALRGTKVANLHPVIARQHQILRLDVAMDYSYWGNSRAVVNAAAHSPMGMAG